MYIYRYIHIIHYINFHQSLISSLVCHYLFLPSLCLLINDKVIHYHHIHISFIISIIIKHCFWHHQYYLSSTIDFSMSPSIIFPIMDIVNYDNILLPICYNWRNQSHSPAILWMVAKSCTTSDGWKPKNHGKNTVFNWCRISQPSTVGWIWQLW